MKINKYLQAKIKNKFFKLLHFHLPITIHHGIVRSPAPHIAVFPCSGTLFPPPHHRTRLASAA